MTAADNATPPVEILDCTVRDGNYAIDFKFTEADTRLLTRELSALGIRWIEVGHGLGLGGMEAGKGNMPAGDVSMIRAAKPVAGDAKIGMFFIPGIADFDHLEKARDAGLDFVRVGYDAPECERAYPYLTRARELGMVPWLNLMKSYGISAAEFGKRAKQAVEAGAEIVACVDSAGSMMPQDVAAYFDAAREAGVEKLGFHGHNNLMMVIANCLTALEHGARYLDVTLCGLGRSAGNAPTEILVAVLERMGISTGLDLFQIMDLIDRYLWPLVGRTRPHDMMGVAAGFSQFHSSFLPKVTAAANRQSAELRRVVVKVAQHDPVHLDTAYLETVCNELRGTALDGSSDELVRFDHPRIKRDLISNSIQGVTALIDGLEVAAAKRPGTRIALHLAPSEEPDAGLVLPEYLLSDATTEMGRVTYGSLEILREVLRTAQPRVSAFLVGQDAEWAHDAARVAAEVVARAAIQPVRDREIRRLALLEVLDRAAVECGSEALFVYGWNRTVEDALRAGSPFGRVFAYGAPANGVLPPGVVPIRHWQDWGSLQLGFNAVLYAIEPTAEDARQIRHALGCAGGGGCSLCLFRPLGGFGLDAADEATWVDLDGAYAGLLARHFALNGTDRAGAAVLA